uniref:TCL1 upstream neural differentiation-associated RNA n=1 Tax=Gasterosteus aculeatus TaxID=69293 RepID=G3P084_GASAC
EGGRQGWEGGGGEGGERNKQDVGETKKRTTCSDEGKKEGSFWPTTWCNVWHRAPWWWGSVMVTMVPSSHYVCSAHAREEDATNDREERILAVLGIIGTVLNLLVVIFVYIYTSVT